jgi:hypothetical protein
MDDGGVNGGVAIGVVLVIAAVVVVESLEVARVVNKSRKAFSKGVTFKVTGRSD